jgi:uncharacterized protein with PhoU and TrkA domain
MDFRILEVLRGERKFLPTARTIIREGDILFVEGRVADLVDVADSRTISGERAYERPTRRPMLVKMTTREIERLFKQ